MRIYLSIQLILVVLAAGIASAEETVSRYVAIAPAAATNAPLPIEIHCSFVNTNINSCPWLHVECNAKCKKPDLAPP